jgi:hypothetical protein
MVTARARRRAAVVLLPLLALTACGDDDDDDIAGDTTADTTTDTTSPVTTAASTTETPTSNAPSSSILPAEAILDQMPEGQIQAVGGIDCATELAIVLEAGQRYDAEQGAAPESLDVLYDEGYIDEPATHWIVEGNQLVPVEGSGCVSLTEAQQIRDECLAAAKTLAVAYEAYFAQTPGAPEPTVDDLVEAGLLREPFDLVDLDDGDVVAADGGPCEAVDLSAAN